jgi:hypothetical protein
MSPKERVLRGCSHIFRVGEHPVEAAPAVSENLSDLLPSPNFAAGELIVYATT